MSPRRIAALLSILFVASSRHATAQSGLLLGVNTTSGYRTLWIAPVAGKPRVVGSGADLIVPGKTGFWRVCVSSRHVLETDMLVSTDTIVAEPATGRRGVCATTDSVTDAEQNARRCESNTRLVIQFVSGDLLSVEESGDSDCGAHPSSGVRHVLTTLRNDTTSLEKLLTSEQRADLRRQSLVAAKKEFEGFGQFNVRDDDARNVNRLADLHDWAVERGVARWQANGTISCTPYVGCGAMSQRFSIPAFRLPKTVVGHDALTPPFSAIRKRYPGARDAVSSPTGDIAVVVTDDEILVFAPTRGELGEPVDRLKVSGTVVMAQWAIGRYVSTWTEQLRSLLLQ